MPFSTATFGDFTVASPPAIAAMPLAADVPMQRQPAEIQIDVAQRKSPIQGDQIGVHAFSHAPTGSFSARNASARLRDGKIQNADMTRKLSNT
jgi:hypothetical protein